MGEVVNAVDIDLVLNVAIKNLNSFLVVNVGFLVDVRVSVKVVKKVSEIEAFN